MFTLSCYGRCSTRDFRCLGSCKIPTVFFSAIFELLLVINLSINSCKHSSISPCTDVRPLHGLRRRSSDDKILQKFSMRRKVGYKFVTLSVAKGLSFCDRFFATLGMTGDGEFLSNFWLGFCNTKKGSDWWLVIVRRTESGFSNEIFSQFELQS